MKIAVGFSTSSMWFSTVIRACTKSKVSHCYIRIYDEFLQTTLVFHVERSMEILRAEEFDRDNIAIEEFIIDDPRLNVSFISNLRHLGKRFDWWDWAGWLPFITRWTKSKVKAPAHSFKKMICVDYVLRVLNDADIAYLPHGVMNPELLRQWFDHYYQKFNWEKVDGIAQLEPNMA